MKKIAIITALAIAFLLSSIFVVSVEAGIPNWQEAYKTGAHGTWAWAKIYAIWNTYTKKYYGHEHYHDWVMGIQVTIE
jgi:hypothetical protein